MTTKDTIVNYGCHRYETALQKTPPLEETYSQFCIDISRIKFIVNGIQDEAISPVCKYALLINLFGDTRVGLWFAYWCTQTALADIYIKKLHALHRESTTLSDVCYHLLDDGRQTLDIVSNYTNHTHETGTLRLFKPFRLCRLDPDGTPQTIQYYHLHIIAFGDPLGMILVEWQTISSPRFLGTFQIHDQYTADDKNTPDKEKHACFRIDMEWELIPYPHKPSVCS